MKPEKNKRLILVGVVTLIATFIWVALDSYHQLIKQDKVGQLDQLIEPLNPRLETEVLEKIRTRKEYQIEEAEKLFLESVRVTPSPVFEATSSAQSVINEELKPTGVATEAGRQQ